VKKVSKDILFFNNITGWTSCVRDMCMYVVVYVIESGLTLFTHAQLRCGILSSKVGQMPQWYCGLDAAVFPQEWYEGQMQQNKNLKKLFLAWIMHSISRQISLRTKANTQRKGEKRSKLTFCIFRLHCDQCQKPSVRRCLPNLTHERGADDQKVDFSYLNFGQFQ
jgi:hypothetical protein